MKITAVTSQIKDTSRVNVMVDGKYRFSLDIFQVGEIGIKIGSEYSDKELTAFEDESQFGKVYGRSLEYCLMRPHSSKEVRDYLYRKTRDTWYQDGSIKKGASPTITERVFNRLLEKGYIDDEKFTRYWVENRSLTKGASKRKLTSELRMKGVDQTVIDKHLTDSERTDADELEKMIIKKQSRYSDPQKFMQYLARQGFSYDDIKSALSDD